MFSIKRLFSLAFIAVGTSLLFFLFNLDNDFIRTEQSNFADSFLPLEAVQSEDMGFTVRKRSYIVVGKPVDSYESAVKENVCSILDSIKVGYSTKDVLTREDLTDTGTAIIFVERNLSKVADLELLANYVDGGGHILLASGLPDAVDSAYLNPVFGIIERGEYLLCDDVTFLEGTLPYPKVSVENGYPSYSYSSRLNESCEILLSGNNSNPLVWVNRYINGSCAVINGTFMENKISEGIFLGALAAMEENFIYPVLGTKTVYFDAIPPLTINNDQKSYEYYGRSAEAFIRDKLWGDLLKSAVTMDFKITSSFLGIDTDSFNPATVNRQTFAYICRQVLQHGGEITLAGNHTELQDLPENKAQAVEKLFSSIFPNYNIYGYYPLYGKVDVEDFYTLRASFNKLNVMRCLLTGDDKVSTVDDFQLLPDGTIIYPTLTYGYSSTGMQMYSFLSMLTGRGVVSHSFDVNSLFTTPEEDSSWNHLGKRYDKLCSDFFGKTRWLAPTTLSEAAQEYRRYELLEYSADYAEDRVTVNCHSMVPENKFLFRSSRKIKSIAGGEYRVLYPNFYLITAREPDIIIELNEEAPT
ncbi:MAG: DUF2194 domain-containing protein [Angelakisella sp.]